MKRSRTRWCRTPRRPEAIAGAILLAVATLGCVSAGSYERLSDEVERLREENERLEAASSGVDRARIEALERAEDLREERDREAAELRRLERKVKELESALAAHERAREAVAVRAAVNDARFGPLRSELDGELASGSVAIVERPEGLRVVIGEEALFAPGASDLTAGGRALLGRIALRIRDEDQRVEVEGGAETPPLRLTRGASVLRALAAGGVPNEQLRAGSFAEEEIAEEEGFPARRGAEIRLLPNLGAGPGAVSAPTPPSPVP